VERRDNQKKRHRQVSNNFGAITPAAPERENSGAAFFSSPFDAGGVAAFDSFAPAQLTFLASHLISDVPLGALCQMQGARPSNK